MSIYILLCTCRKCVTSICHLWFLKYINKNHTHSRTGFILPKSTNYHTKYDHWSVWSLVLPVYRSPSLLLWRWCLSFSILHTQRLWYTVQNWVIPSYTFLCNICKSYLKPKLLRRDYVPYLVFSLVWSWRHEFSKFLVNTCWVMESKAPRHCYWKKRQLDRFAYGTVVPNEDSSLAKWSQRHRTSLVSISPHLLLLLLLLLGWLPLWFKGGIFMYSYFSRYTTEMLKF